MDWSRVTSADAWKGFALETAWKVSPAQTDREFVPTWPLNPRDLSGVRIFWPTAYQWEPSSKWVESLRRGFSRYVKIELAEIPQTLNGIVVIGISIRGTNHKIAIDYSDYPQIDDACARDCLLYFKMQFSSEGYALQNVVPGGFVPFKDDIYAYLPKVRVLADKRTYRYDVYGRFGQESAVEIRRNACNLLANQNHFRWEGSLQVKRYALSLWEIAHSKICIDLPGSGDFCFRLIDYMAVGACVIAARHHTVLQSPLVDGRDIVYVKDDLSDLVDLCRFYLEHDDARETLRANSRNYFDRYLHRDQLAAYYLHLCLKQAQ